jgi:hypothetical protein
VKRIDGNVAVSCAECGATLVKSQVVTLSARGRIPVMRPTYVHPQDDLAEWIESEARFAWGDR